MLTLTVLKGSDKFNDELSAKRANAVKAYLEKAGDQMTLKDQDVINQRIRIYCSSW